MNFWKAHENMRRTNDDLIGVIIVWALIIVMIGIIVAIYQFGIAPAFDTLIAQQAARREASIQECINAFDYTRAQCAFILDHPDVRIQTVPYVKPVGK